MLRYWLWLATRKGLSARERLAVLEHFGSPEAAYFADEAEYALIAPLQAKGRAVLMEKSLDEAEQILSNCYEKQIQILTWQDAHYPQRLRTIDDPPVVLYYKGRLIAFDEEPVVAMVGARRATAYGLLVAKRLGFQAGRCGLVVISGMAAGVDSMALTGALSAGRPVAGVLGCGADVIYPRSNESLYHDVEAHGCLLTEYPPGTPPYGRNFPVRNRILSALSLGVVVVEAGERSGALITAHNALEQGRDVFAVPANIGVAASAGSNQLLKEGAIYAETGWNIAREYLHLFPDKLREYSGGQGIELTEAEREPPESRMAQRVASEPRVPAKDDKKSIDKAPAGYYIDLQAIRDELSDDERTITSLLYEQPLSVDDLIDRAQIPASRILASLTLLEVRGFAVRLAGRRYRLAYRQEQTEQTSN